MALLLPRSRTHVHNWKRGQDLSGQTASALPLMSSYWVGNGSSCWQPCTCCWCVPGRADSNILSEAPLCFAGCEWPHAVADQAAAGPSAGLNTSPLAHPTPAHAVTGSNPTSLSGRSWLSRNARIKTVGAPLLFEASMRSMGCTHVEGTVLGARCIDRAVDLSPSIRWQAVTDCFRVGALLMPGSAVSSGNL